MTWDKASFMQSLNLWSVKPDRIRIFRSISPPDALLLGTFLMISHELASKKIVPENYIYSLIS